MSATTQNEDRQILSLTEYGIKRANIYVDKQSGKDFKRPAYMRLMKKLNKGDVPVIKVLTAWAEIMTKSRKSGKE